VPILAKGKTLDVEQELIEVFKQNGLVNEYFVKVLPTTIWRMNPPSSRVRSIAAIVSRHRCAHAKCAPHVRRDGWRATRPKPLLDRNDSTPQQAQRALHQSTDDLAACS